MQLNNVGDREAKMKKTEVKGYQSVFQVGVFKSCDLGAQNAPTHSPNNSTLPQGGGEDPRGGY
jgi:hypothetical protein